MNKYSEELKQIFKQCEKEALMNSNYYVGSEHFLLALFSLNNRFKDLFNTNYLCIKNLINKEDNSYGICLYSVELLRCIESSIIELDNLKYDITLPTLLISILKDNNSNAYKILSKLSVNIDYIINNIEIENSNSDDLLINKIAVNLNNEAKNNNLEPVIGRNKEINELIEILARKNKSNPLLIGEAGVGKSAIVEELARRIVNEKVPSFLKNKIILSLNLSFVIAGTKYRGEFEEKINTIIRELENNKNFIVFIDEVHTIVGAGGAEGAIDASNILKPALARNKLKCIGATTINEYRNSIEKDKALDRRFEKVFINEPNIEETKNIIIKIKNNYEEYHNIKISNNYLDILINLTNKYIKNKMNPDKCIDVLDHVCAHCSINKRNSKYEKLQKKLNNLYENKKIYIKKGDFFNASLIKDKIDSLNKELSKIKINNKSNVSLKDIRFVLESKINSVIYELKEKTYLYELNVFLKNNIYNQDNNIDNLCNIINYHYSNNKLTCINIEGYKGCGKTYFIDSLVKQLKLHCIKINMSEFNNEYSISKIITDDYFKKSIFEEIKDYPNSLILINNIDNAHFKVQNLIDSIIDTNKLNLSNNEVLDFSNSIFVFEKEISLNNNIGFINSNNELSNYKAFTLKLNQLRENDIINIIKSKDNSLNVEQINEIVNKSNYLINGACHIDELINKYKIEVYS